MTSVWVATKEKDPYQLPVIVGESIGWLSIKLGLTKGMISRAASTHIACKGYFFERIWIPETEEEEMQADFFESCTERLVMQ